ncbi:MAG: hypothetical protein JWN37_177 [Candidatus Nomurabacteria bacterium]|nr:hypothetical protein [Candidatus Nomurabacteria bacterium]
MHDKQASFAGITLHIDPVSKKRREGSDNVMAIFWEEQPMWWYFIKDIVKNTIQKVKAPVDFLDVGTGGGVMAILAKKHAGAKIILAIDKSLRAVKESQKNAKRNKTPFKTKLEFYNTNTAPYKSVKVISINAPYHLYPKEMEMDIPQHARGGIDGQQVFKEQLAIANYHLADHGIIVFNQMCLGRMGRPEFIKYIPELIEGASLVYTNIFPPIKSKVFFRKVYGNTFTSYQNEMSKKYPELYYCNGVITRNGKGSVKRVVHRLDLKGRSWEDRFELHRQISKHGVR